MPDPKKPEEIDPLEHKYPTPPLDPNTGAPIDSRFPPKPEEKEETARKPSPKSEKEEEDKPKRRR